MFSRPLRRGSFEFLCRAALSAATLEQALDRIARFLHVVLDDLEVEVERSGRAAVIVISEEQALPVGPAGRVFAFEWLLRMIHGLAAWLVAHPLPLDEVAFPYPPPLHAADYELVFAPRYTFDAPRLEARFPAEWLALPVRRDEAALRVFLADAPASITTLYRRDRALGLAGARAPARRAAGAAGPARDRPPAVPFAAHPAPPPGRRGHQLSRHQGRPAPRPRHRLADQDRRGP